MTMICTTVDIYTKSTVHILTGNIDAAAYEPEQGDQNYVFANPIFLAKIVETSEI